MHTVTWNANYCNYNGWLVPSHESHLLGLPQPLSLWHIYAPTISWYIISSHGYQSIPRFNTVTVSKSPTFSTILSKWFLERLMFSLAAWIIALTLFVTAHCQPDGWNKPTTHYLQLQEDIIFTVWKYPYTVHHVYIYSEMLHKVNLSLCKS